MKYNFSSAFILGLITDAISRTLIDIPTGLNGVNKNNDYEYDASETITKDRIDPRMPVYYSWFASFGYCIDSIVVAGKCCEDYFSESSWKVVAHGYEPKDKKNNFILLESKKFKKFVITFPGTRQPTELITQVIRSYLEPLDTLKGVRVTHYFNARAKAIINEIFTETTRRYIAVHPGYQIIFTGHSLGGAVATIIALKAVKDGGINPVTNPPILITFGQPRTGNDQFANEVMKYIPDVIRVVREGDTIGSTPLCLPKWNGDCKSVLPNDRFSPSFVPDNNSNSNYWHIGGLVMLNKDMTKGIVCDYLKGENMSGACDIKVSFYKSRHSYYFTKNVKLSKRCSTVK